jgi:hypothetical protein
LSRLLKQLPQLREFSYGPKGAFDAEAPFDVEQQLVEVLPQLQNLQWLQLERVGLWESPSSCASLTASRQLTALVLIECGLPAGAVQHMFGAGQQLQQLQVLEVAPPLDMYEVDYVQGTLEHNASLLQPDSLQLGPGDLKKLASCCPRLCSLRVIWCDLPGPAEGEAASEAVPLLQLTALTALRVAGQYWNDPVVEKALANMTGEVNSSLFAAATCCCLADRRTFSHIARRGCFGCSVYSCDASYFCAMFVQMTA